MVITVIMTTEFQSGLLSLIQSALTDDEPSLPAGFDFRAAYEFAKVQQILPLVYYGALKDPAFLVSAEAQAFLESACVYIGHSADQMDAVERICAAFEAAGVSHMPLKGAVLKSIYPAPEMRTMGDADILIRVDEYDRVKTVMQSLGFAFDKESDHEYIWRNATGLVIELHKRLIPSYNEDYFAYYGDGWRKAHPAAGWTYRHEMSPEDHFIYLFTHLAKHFRDQGVGVKYVVDLYVYRRHYTHLDMAYITRELEKLRLRAFFENVMALIDVWFCGAAGNEVTDYLGGRIWADGVYGKPQLNALSEGVKLSKTTGDTGAVKARKKWRLLFPPYKQMCLRNPVLKKWPILLPFLWIRRLVNAFLHRRYRYREEMERVDRMSEENIDAYQRELNFVGLDYHFGEENAGDAGGFSEEAHAPPRIFRT